MRKRFYDHIHAAYPDHQHPNDVFAVSLHEVNVPPDIPIGIYEYLLTRIIRQVRFRLFREWSYAGPANVAEAVTRRARNVICKFQMHTTFEPVAFSRRRA